jgi:alginate O-acetyltransferase complex protein AlgI
LTSTHAIAWSFRALAWTTVAWLIGWRGVLLLVVAAVLTQAAALALDRVRDRPAAAQALLAVGVAVNVLILGSTVWRSTEQLGMPIGVAVFSCHAIAYLVDVRRGVVEPRRHLAALLYLVQLPVFPAGPLSRFNEFNAQLVRGDVSMAGFSFGVRRIVTGLTKVYLLAGPLGSAAERIFSLRVTRLSIDTAWLGAVCAALEMYFWLSGFSDIGIGLGKIAGFRYQENFRRPYTADSIREFWRRWNITLITWLRDYVSLPIVGHDRPTFGLYLLTIVGLMIVGVWYRASIHVVPWAIYFATWLAAESLGLGQAMQRVPRVLRHAYVLIAVLFGWMLLYAAGPGPLLGYTEAMLGFSIVRFGASSEYLTPSLVTALICAIVFAGPLVGNISRWRVSVDAATASLLMMLAATGVFLWQGLNPIRRVVFPGGASKRFR